MSTSAEPIFFRSDISVDNPVELVRWYLREVRRGPDYYGRSDVVIGNPDAVEFGDLAWAVLLEGRPSSAAAQELLNNAPIPIVNIETKPLGELNDEQRNGIVDAIFKITKLTGFGTSIATKVLHVKRRNTVPVMDNQAIFGSFMQRSWRVGDNPRHGTVTKRSSIEAALQAIYKQMIDPTSDDGWRTLRNDVKAEFHLDLTQIEIFDVCWWAVLRANAATHRKAGLRTDSYSGPPTDAT